MNGPFFLSQFFLTSNRSKPIRVLTRTKSSSSNDCLPIGYLLRDSHPNRNIYLHSRRIFLNRVFVRRTQNFKLQTSSIPIRVLTFTKSSCSDYYQPISYLFCNFQLNRSNFFAPPTPALTRQKGGRQGGIGVIVKNFNSCHKQSRLLKFRNRYKNM